MSDIQLIEIEPRVIEVIEVASVIVQNTDVLPADRIAGIRDSADEYTRIRQYHQNAVSRRRNADVRTDVSIRSDADEQKMDAFGLGG